MRRRVRGEASARVAAAWNRTMFAPIEPARIPTPADAHPRPEGCESPICGAPQGCQRKACRFRAAPGYPVQAMGDAE